MAIPYKKNPLQIQNVLQKYSFLMIWQGLAPIRLKVMVKVTAMFTIPSLSTIWIARCPWRPPEGELTPKRK
jgi:hypothetical protein